MKLLFWNQSIEEKSSISKMNINFTELYGITYTISINIEILNMIFQIFPIQKIAIKNSIHNG